MYLIKRKNLVLDDFKISNPNSNEEGSWHYNKDGLGGLSIPAHHASVLILGLVLTPSSH